MGSVIDYFACPNCGQDAFSDFYYKTGEEYVHCSYCGYHHTAEIVNRNKPLNKLITEDWKFTTITNPYGAFKLRFKGDNAATCGSMRTEKEWNRYKAAVLSSEANNEIDHFSLSRYVDGVFHYFVYNGTDFLEVIESTDTQELSES